MIRRALLLSSFAAALSLSALAGPSPGSKQSVVESPAPSPWSFTLEPYAWSPGVYGTVGVGRLPSMKVNASPIDILRNLDWGIFARGEIRHARWGLLLDGFYARFSTSVTPAGPLYESAKATLAQSIDSAVAAYRVVDRDAGSLDVYAGARLYYMSLSLSATVERSRFNQVADALLARRLPTGASGQRTWIDPVVGLRGKARIYRPFYASAQADVGGFGAGSEIAFFTQAALGVDLTRQVSAEFGYRYMFVDYENNGFLFRANMPGVYAGLGVTF